MKHISWVRKDLIAETYFFNEAKAVLLDVQRNQTALIEGYSTKSGSILKEGQYYLKPVKRPLQRWFYGRITFFHTQVKRVNFNAAITYCAILFGMSFPFNARLSLEFDYQICDERKFHNTVLNNSDEPLSLDQVFKIIGPYFYQAIRISIAKMTNITDPYNFRNLLDICAINDEVNRHLSPCGLQVNLFLNEVDITPNEAFDRLAEDYAKLRMAERTNPCLLQQDFRPNNMTSLCQQTCSNCRFCPFRHNR